MTGLVLLLGWWVAPWVSTARPSVQGMVWIPEWLWFLAMLPGAVILVAMSLRLASRRIGACWVLVAVLPLLIVGRGVWNREWHPVRPPGSEEAARIVFLNANHPSRATRGDMLDAIQAHEPDLMLVVNPGWLAPMLRAWVQDEREDAEGPESQRRDDWTVRWIEPLMVASPHGNVSIRTLAMRDGIRAMRLILSEPVAEALGMSNVLVVDLPSDPNRNRTDILRRLADVLEKHRDENGLEVDLLVGDFNTTPRTIGIDRVWPGLMDLFPESGSGWGATWPRERPLIRIDLALASEQVDSNRLSTFDPGGGGHRGLVIEIIPDR